MRDPARIKPFMDALTEFWEQHAEWRFAQVVVNAFRSMQLEDTTASLFYMEDDAMEDGLTDLAIAALAARLQYGEALPEPLFPPALRALVDRSLARQPLGEAGSSATPELKLVAERLRAEKLGASE